LSREIIRLFFDYSLSAKAVVRQRVVGADERPWRLEDFRDLPFEAAGQALSRLRHEGTLERLSKGVYYRTRETAFGKSRPSPTAIQKLASQRKGVFPEGMYFTARVSSYALDPDAPARQNVTTMPARST